MLRKSFVLLALVAFAGLATPTEVCGQDPFRRGDANSDAHIDICDSVFILNFLFLGTIPPGCFDAADAQDDGTIDLTDPIFLLVYLFLGGAPPPPPGTAACGADPTADGLPVCVYAPALCGPPPPRVPDPRFDLTFSAPLSVTASPNVLVQFTAMVQLDNTDPVDAWSLSVRTSPLGTCTIIDATVDGTAGADVSDTPPGARNGGFEATELTLGAGNEGAVSSVILALTMPIALDPLNSPHDLLKLTVEGPTPASDCEPCALEFFDGLQGSGQPVENLVSEFLAPTCFFKPVTTNREVELCAEGPRETKFRIDVVGGTPGDKVDDVRPWRIDADCSRGSVPVELCVVLESAFQSCLADPVACNGGENIIQETPQGRVYGCGDGIDNDGDGLIDDQDPDCHGAQGWAISLKTDPCFNVSGATTAGTVGDLIENPPGLRDVGFEVTQVIDPNQNGGMEGVVSAVVLSVIHRATLDPVGEEKVLRVMGSIDTSGVAPGECTEPCALTFTDGLRGTGEPVRNVVVSRGEIVIPDFCNATIEVCCEETNEPPDCSEAELSATTCWPPNHKFVLVDVLGVTDPDGDDVTITITGITQDEPVLASGRGSGRTCPDGVMVDTDGDGNPEAAGLRCERDGRGNGRVYHVSYTASDGNGGECSGTLTFCVPHDMGGGSDCIDDGPHFDSTACGDGGAGEAGTGALSLDEFESLTPEPLFLRGDVNWDETYDVSDAIRILDFLFLSSVSIVCFDAADVNDDGELDVSDPIGLLGFLFVGDTRPPPPVVLIDVDATPDGLLCE